MAERYCKACDGWHDLGQPWPMACVPVAVPARSGLPFPMVISDSMPPTEHVDGRLYTSKRAFRRVTRERGFIEVGNEKQKPFKRKDPDRASIRASLERAKARVS